MTPEHNKVFHTVLTMSCVGHCRLQLVAIGSRGVDLEERRVEYKKALISLS